MQTPSKRKGPRGYQPDAILQKPHFQKKGSKMNVQEPIRKGNDELRTRIDVLLDTVQIMISSATPHLGAGDRYAVIPRSKIVDAIRAMDDLTLEVYA